MSDAPFHRRDAVGAGTKGAIVTGGVGLMLSAVQNSLAKRNVGALGVITRSGMTIALFTAMGGSFSFVKAAAANIREKDDYLNPTFGGLVAGAILGTKFRTLPAVVGYGAGMAILLGAFDYAGGSLRGWGQKPGDDEFARKEALRANKRRPLEETVAALGEGRGIYGPGYEERRRERLATKLGDERQ